MKGVFLAVLTALFFQSALSQETANAPLCTEGSAEYTARYEKLKAMYIEMQNKQSSKDFIALNNAFKEKSNFKASPQEMYNQAKNGFNAQFEWVRNNIEKTGFKNCEEAEAEITKLLNQNIKFVMENKDTYAYANECLKLCEGLLVNLYIELSREYGKDFLP
ncbi:hypothetical protein CHU92_00485 [Flavobacterium cyanobacteriorum]|uniref:Lysozyme inhibitor LprI N-terminal domain-containing protein n=1 Tax=Flavobacterium cyanobacteriorum TaxID=2022802 RepID=A0A256A789_9FLAO|nr:hypothetical protein [Flavobacterium cyanobacteriorum]OYQ49025.1 hypothetical protein CHU92_00485 [Flavobacterium cyanobacteriorum]